MNKRVAVTTIALLCVSAVAAADKIVEGRLIDERGLPVANGTVTLSVDGSVKASTRTGPDGSFELPPLPAGSYVASASRQGDRSAQILRSVQVVDGAPEALELRLSDPFSDEITVVGTRIASEPSHIPGATTLLDRETLESSRSFSTSEVLRKAAGVTVRDEEGLGLRPNIGIRGLNPTRSSKVLLLEDGLPLTYAPYGDNASYYHPPIERFDAIEVLKGSGQIAYGPSTISGVINYLTPAPPSEPEITMRLIGGTRDYMNAHLTAGGTWGKTGLIVDLMRKHSDGSRDNLTSDLSDVNAKIVHTFSPDQSLTFRANWYGEDSNVTYSGLRQSEFEQNPRQNPFRNDFFYGDRYGMSVAHRMRLSGDAILTTSVYGAKFKRHWWRQSSNSAQRPNDSADPACGGMANLNSTCGNEGRLRQFTTFGIEPRLRWARTLFGLRSDLQLGARAHFEDQERLQVNGDSPTARSGRTIENNARDNRAFSAFVQDSLTFGRWSVTPGVRVEHVTFERRNRLAAGASGKTTLTQLVPGLGVSWLYEDTTLFAGLHRGFAPPRTEDIISNTGGVVDLDAELSWNSEVGVRSLIRPGLNVAATLFRMDYENQIVAASVAGGVGATLTNGGETSHEGLELEARADSSPLFNTTHNVYVTLAHTNLWRAEFAGDRLSNIPGFTSVSVSGNRLPYAPRHTITAGAGYMRPSGLELFVEAVHVDSQFGDDLNSVAPSADGQRGLLPAHTVWNATANYDVPQWSSTFFVSVKNAFDELYIADRARGILPGPPRLLQAGVIFRR
jgi:Fe(3+) dicitrate transport protein